MHMQLGFRCGNLRLDVARGCQYIVHVCQYFLAGCSSILFITSSLIPFSSLDLKYGTLIIFAHAW